MMRPMASVYTRVYSVYKHDHIVTTLGEELVCHFSNYSMIQLPIYMVTSEDDIIAVFLNRNF